MFFIEIVRVCLWFDDDQGFFGLSFRALTYTHMLAATAVLHPHLAASDELTIPSNLARGLYIETVGLLGGTGGATPPPTFLEIPLTWKLLVRRLIVEFILLSETVETALPVTLGTTRWPPRATMVEVDDIYKMQADRN